MSYGWENSERSFQQYQNNENHHESSFGHEALAGAASFGAFKIFEDRQRQEGKPVSHQFAKELLAGIAGAEVDKLIETKGLDYIDREKAKRQAKENAERMYDEHYIQGHGAQQYDPNQYAPPQHFERHGFEGYDERRHERRRSRSGERRHDERRHEERYDERRDERREERYDERRDERYDDRRY